MEYPIYIPEKQLERDWDHERGVFRPRPLTYRLPLLNPRPRETDFIAYLTGRTDL